MFDLYRVQNAWQMLHTEGNQLLNEKGEKVRLLGVNCAPLVWTSYSREIMDMITYACDEWKANTIRLPLAQERWFGFGKEQKGVDESGERYRSLVDDIVATVACRHKYIILDLHRHRIGAPI